MLRRPARVAFDNLDLTFDTADDIKAALTHCGNLQRLGVAVASMDQDSVGVAAQLIVACQGLPELNTVVLSYMHNTEALNISPAEAQRFRGALVGVDAALAQLPALDMVVLTFVDDESGEESNMEGYRRFLEDRGATFLSTLSIRNKIT